MSRVLKFGAFTIALLTALACSAAPAGTGNPTATPGNGTPGATIGATPTPVPTTGVTAPPVGGHECDAFPTFNPAASVQPTFAPDPVLEAKFPAQIDGQPVTDLRSGYYLQSLCFGGQAAVDRIRGDAQFDLLTLTTASATATVDDEDVSLQAFRAPGQDASVIVAILLRIAQQEPGVTAPPIVPGTAGGKSVITVTVDGGTNYGYASGDTLFFATDLTSSQADKIFAALP